MWLKLLRLLASTLKAHFQETSRSLTLLLLMITSSHKWQTLVKFEKKCNAHELSIILQDIHLDFEENLIVRRIILNKIIFACLLLLSICLGQWNYTALITDLFTLFLDTVTEGTQY